MRLMTHDANDLKVYIDFLNNVIPIRVNLTLLNMIDLNKPENPR